LIQINNSYVQQFHGLLNIDGLPAHSKQARADHSTAPNGASLRLAITVWLMPPVHMNLVSQYDNSGVEFVS